MMKNLLKRASCALLPLMLASAASAAAPALPDAEPAMWMVKDKDTTIYLFGTFHALDGKRDWFNDEVKQAFDASQDVVLEIVTPDDPKDMLPALQKYAMSAPGSPTLTSKLSPAGRKRLADVLARHKMPPTALDRFMAAHPAAPRAFATVATPTSFARETYNGINAFVFVDAAGKRQPFRFQIQPVAGSAHMTPGEAARQPRYSTPYFLHANPDYLIRTLPQCVTADNPDRYPDPITANDYLMQRLREIKLA